VHEVVDHLSFNSTIPSNPLRGGVPADLLLLLFGYVLGLGATGLMWWLGILDGPAAQADCHRQRRGRSASCRKEAEPLRREARAVLRAADIEHGDDMLVIEIGDVLGFRQISFDIFGSSNQPAVGHFDSNATVELIIVSLIDPSEAALAQETYHSVATNLRRPLHGNSISSQRL
jgi:hypothetical protein